METYGKILIIAMPLFLLLVLFEKWYGWRKGFDTVRTLDMVSSLSSGITNSTKDVLGLSLAIISYGWLVEHMTIYQVQSSWLLYVIAFLALDFSGYWVHRLAHSVNFFWNNHIVLKLFSGLFALTYIWLYWAIVRFKTPKWLVIRNKT